MREDDIKMNFKRMDFEESTGSKRPNTGLAVVVVVKSAVSRSGDFAGQFVRAHR
jgi:hypothetical protein